MGRGRAFAAYVALVALSVAGCSSSSNGSAPTPTAPVPITTPDSPSTLPSESVPMTRSATPLPVTTSDPDPIQPRVPPDVPTTGPNTRPGEKPPVMPLEATQHTARGAQAFAAFFIKTIDWGFATVSGAYAQHFSAAHCDGCRAFIDSLDHDRRLHHRYVGGRVAIRHARLLSRPEGDGAEYTALVSYDLSAYVELAASGKPVDGAPAQANQRFYVSVNWARTGWAVEQLTAGS